MSDEGSLPVHADWRRLGAFLWAGSGPDGPVGTIEHGRRFNAVDTEGTLVGRCRDLREAQHLIEELALHGEPIAGGPRKGRHRVR